MDTMNLLQSIPEQGLPSTNKCNRMDKVRDESHRQAIAMSGSQSQRHRKYQRVPLAAAEQCYLTDDVTHYDDATLMMQSLTADAGGDDDDAIPSPQSFTVRVTVEDYDRGRNKLDQEMLPIGKAEKQQQNQKDQHIKQQKQIPIPEPEVRQEDDEKWSPPEIRCYDDVERILLNERPEEVIQDDLERSQQNSGDRCQNDDSANSNFHWPMREFAERYYNRERACSNKRKQTIEIPVAELLKYTKKSAQKNSLLHLLVSDSVSLATSMFKNICSYIHGELKDTDECLRGVLKLCLNNVDLRDELYCQLIRQSTECPREEINNRVWHIFCLCSVSFNPSQALRKYLLSFLRQRESKVIPTPYESKCATYCLHHLSQLNGMTRQKPPSKNEITAVINLQSLITNIHFLDESRKSLKVEPTERVQDVLKRVQRMVPLNCLDGWALYESRPGFERHLETCEFIADIFSDWERYHMAQLMNKKTSHWFKRCQPRRNAIPRVSVGTVNGQQACKVSQLPPQPPPPPQQGDMGVVGASLGGVSGVAMSLDAGGLCSKKLNREHVTRDGFNDDGGGGGGGGIRDASAGEYGEDLGGRHGRLIFCKHVFKRRGPVIGKQDMSYDPSECHLLYVQALHSVIQSDELHVNKQTALHLAGLQAQVKYGNYIPNHETRYMAKNHFISQRLLYQKYNWTHLIEVAHKKYGGKKTATEAKLNYLSILSQFPLYGCTKFFAHYRGVWQYGVETILAFSAAGLRFISVQDAVVITELFYAEIESVHLEERYGEFYVVVELRSCVSQEKQKVYMFECVELDALARVIEVYSPRLAKWLEEGRKWRSLKVKSPDNWIQILDDMLKCRKALIANGIVDICPNEENGLLLATIYRLSGRACCLDDVNVHSERWFFSPVATRSTITKISSHQSQYVCIRLFNMTLVYTKVNQVDTLNDNDLIILMQTMLAKCMENEEICNEFYLQLIKQTTDSKSCSTSKKMIIRYWHLLTIMTCLVLPCCKYIFHYLILHLKRNSVQKSSEIGKYANFCIQSVCRTYQWPGRKYPISKREMTFILNRHPIEARVNLTNGQQMLVEFDSSSSVAELLNTVKSKIGMRLDAKGYSIFQLSHNNSEHYLSPEIKLADCLYQLEQPYNNINNMDKEVKFIFKKRLFLDDLVSIHDPVECEFLYQQLMTNLFEEKIHLTKTNVLKLCAMRAQTEYGDFGKAHQCDYNTVIRILPRHCRELVNAIEIASFHKLCHLMSPISANHACLRLLTEWPLSGALFYEVTTNRTSLPKVLWLAVSHKSLHLLNKDGQVIYNEYAYEHITTLDFTTKYFSFTSKSMEMSTFVIIYSSQVNEILELIKDYTQSYMDIGPIIHKLAH